MPGLNADGTDPFRITVVGGSMGGWIAALVLRRESELRGFATTISVIEPSWIPSIDVGEGTTAVFRGFLDLIGADEFEFLRETGATIKYGICHQDWRKLEVTYDGPIDDPHLISRLRRREPRLPG